MIGVPTLHFGLMINSRKKLIKTPISTTSIFLFGAGIPSKRETKGNVLSENHKLHVINIEEKKAIKANKRIIARLSFLKN
jgi:hypothetical protein